jgi:hypothetical protein
VSADVVRALAGVAVGVGNDAYDDIDVGGTHRRGDAAEAFQRPSSRGQHGAGASASESAAAAQHSAAALSPSRTVVLDSSLTELDAALVPSTWSVRLTTVVGGAARGSSHGAAQCSVVLSNTTNDPVSFEVRVLQHILLVYFSICLLF